jgi:small conductance mechanosensitive channel
MPSLSAKELTTDLLIRYGFQILGALLILGVGLILARYVGNLTGRWLERRALEPPVRSLMVKTVRVVVLIFTLVVALDKFGFQVAPLVAGIGVAGLGIGIALQGVLSNLVAGLSIILTKPFRVGEWISIVGVYGAGERHRALRDDTVAPRSVAGGHPEPEDRRRDPAQPRDHQTG